jgi:hypothetical protein
MLDLYNNKYDRKILKEHIYDLRLIDILKTQTLDITFIVRYILSDLYQFDDEDRSIDVDMVIKYQPHIHREKLMELLLNYNSDDDSVEDFETYSKRTSK